MIRFVTEYDAHDGRRYGYMVDACDEAHAQMICDARRPGERVVGVLHAVMKVGEPCHERADAMCKAFAESGDDDPPPSDQFLPINDLGLFA